MTCCAGAAAADSSLLQLEVSPAASASLALVAARHGAPRGSLAGTSPAPKRHSPGARSAAHTQAAGYNGAPASRGPGAESAAAGGAGSSGRVDGGDGAGGLGGAGAPWEGWEDPGAAGGSGGGRGLRRFLGRLARGGAGGSDELGFTGKRCHRYLCSVPAKGTAHGAIAWRGFSWHPACPSALHVL